MTYAVSLPAPHQDWPSCSLRMPKGTEASEKAMNGIWDGGLNGNVCVIL